MKTARDAVQHALSTHDGAKPLGRQVIDDLWGEGFTIVRRNSDPFAVDERTIPHGMAYQWCLKSDQEYMTNTHHWSPVPSLRYDGIYAPAGYDGWIEHDGLILMEKLKSEVDAALAENAAKAHRNVSGWVEKNAAEGFTGSIRVQEQSDKAIGEARKTSVGDEQNNDRTKIPADMFPYLKEIFAERDRITRKLRRDGVDASAAKEQASDMAIQVIGDAIAKANNDISPELAPFLAEINIEKHRLITQDGLDLFTAAKQAIETVRNRHKDEINAARQAPVG